MSTATLDGGHLKAFIERLEEEKKATADDIKDVYAEAKGNGYDVKAMREIVRRRKQDSKTLSEEQLIVALYESAIMSKEIKDAFATEGRA